MHCLKQSMKWEIPSWKKKRIWYICLQRLFSMHTFRNQSILSPNLEKISSTNFLRIGYKARKNLCMIDVISKNRLQLFKQSNVSQSSSKAKQKMDSVVADRKLFSRLFIACQSRTGDLEDFFSHENHSYPISISEYGKLRKCTGKSDFLKCLNEIIDPSEEQPVTQAKIIDGAALINMNPPRSSKVLEITVLKSKAK